MHLYEIIPDEYTPSGAPKRRYVGIEGSNGELIPSSRIRGRKQGFSPAKKNVDAEAKTAQLTEELNNMKVQIASSERTRADYLDLLASLDQLVRKYKNTIIKRLISL